MKIRKRKKDIKAKYEPEEFRDQLVQELKPVANENAETVGKHLDSLSEKLDYKTYGETLFDVLFTGGMLGAVARGRIGRDAGPAATATASLTLAVRGRHPSLRALRSPS